MSRNHLEDYMASYMSEDDDVYDAQPQPEIHEPDEPAASGPDHPDMPPPTANRTFRSSKEAMEYINNFTRDYGYALTTARSKRDKGDGEIKVIYLHCDRSGIYRSRINEETRVRQKSSRLSDCPFRAALRRRKGVDYWTLEVTNEQHNHGPAPVHTHPTLRHMDLEARAPQIQGQLASGIHPRQIINAAMREDVDSLIPRDIYNFRQKKHFEFLDGRTPIQALLTSLPDEGNWIFNYEKTADGVVTALFCTHKTSLEILRMNPYILIMDCTYKTNKYKMPLRITATSATFFVGFGFIQNEQQPSYDFVLRSLESVYQQIGLLSPQTIMTDKDKALIRAIEDVFPIADSMLCIWHVNKNILTKARPLLRKELLETAEEAPDPNDKEAVAEFRRQVDKKWKEMLGLWWKVVDAKTRARMVEAWDDFKDQYNDEIFRPLIAYIEDEWLNEDTQHRFLHCYTDIYLHFDMRATSRGEGSHWMLKRDLGTSVADLLTVIRSFERTVTHQHELFKKALDQERINKPTSMLKSFLVGNVLTKASQHALRKVINIHDRYLSLGRGKEEIPPLCSGNTKRTMGIPCIHVIMECIEMQRPLSLDQFHEQWYLYRPEDLPPVNPRMIVLEPRVVASGRGRPAGATNIPTTQPTGRQDTSTRREPSAFERVLSQEEPRRRGRGRGRGSERVQPYTQPNGDNNEPHGNTRGGRRGARARGAQRTDQRGQYEGIPGEMTGVLEF